MSEPGLDRVPTELEWRRLRRQTEAVDEYLAMRPPQNLELEHDTAAPTFGNRVTWFLDDVWFYTKHGVNLTPHFISLSWGLLVKNWKTTLGAIVGAIAYVLNATGVVQLTAEIQMAVVTVALFIIGLFSADAKKEQPKD